ncbi:hypothetical protein [Candidatus Spongiihabitans sp.]|uniref:hypothetical protein n=1 Tax=Candidatus Spongiihabitans sp. TaxID=3101308 RepID=UPI003C7B6337
MKTFINIFAIIGIALVALISIGLYLDIKEMDRTEGGYEAPFVGETGEPIDWDSMDLSSTGLVRRGYVVDFLVNGTTGMISLEMFGIKFEARKLSERAIVVHKPREAFIRRGFKPQF